VAIPGAVDGADFVACAARVLAPSLRPGQVVVLDKSTAHKREETRSAVEAVGARLLFLSAYSPDFNPIELAFAKVKQRLHMAADRTPEGCLPPPPSLAMPSPPRIPVASTPTVASPFRPATMQPALNALTRSGQLAAATASAMAAALNITSRLIVEPGKTGAGMECGKRTLAGHCRSAAVVQ
jgi:hypothetical protein